MLSSGFSLHWANFLEQVAGLNRLGQVIIHSGVDANLTISMHRMGDKGDHGNVVPSRTLARPDGAGGIAAIHDMTGPWMSMRTRSKGSRARASRASAPVAQEIHEDLAQPARIANEKGLDGGTVPV